MRRPRREQNSILLNGMASPAGVDLTNDYATGLGTKLDYGFAPAGGHTSYEPAYFAPLLELSPTVPLGLCFFHDYAGRQSGTRA